MKGSTPEHGVVITVGSGKSGRRPGTAAPPVKPGWVDETFGHLK